MAGSHRHHAHGAHRHAKGSFKKSPPSAKATCSKICPGMKDEDLKKDLEAQREMLEQKKFELDRWNEEDQAKFQKWFGTSDESARQNMSTRVDRLLELNSQTTPDKFRAASPVDKDEYAYVYEDDKQHRIYINKLYCEAPRKGSNSKAGTLNHEMSHFKGYGGTEDHAYGEAASLKLATQNSTKALNNADNFQYWTEN